MGSVLLAGILLKVGGYGLLRFTWPLFPVGSEYFAKNHPFIMVLCCYGSLLFIYGLRWNLLPKAVKQT